VLRNRNQAFPFYDRRPIEVHLDGRESYAMAQKDNWV
jgi:hypothetical protein